MNASLIRLVRDRAEKCCEYCLLPQSVTFVPHEIEHIVAQQHGGPTVERNLALACFACNHHKGPNLAGVDPRTGKRTWLFNPRRQKWARHFRWRGAILLGRTPVGRTTVAVLAINLPYRVEQREALILEGVFPPC